MIKNKSFKGKEGVKQVLNMIRSELDYALRLSGRERVWMKNDQNCLRMSKHRRVTIGQRHCRAKELFQFETLIYFS